MVPESGQSQREKTSGISGATYSHQRMTEQNVCTVTFMGFLFLKTRVFSQGFKQEAMLLYLFWQMSQLGRKHPKYS